MPESDSLPSLSWYMWEFFHVEAFFSSVLGWKGPRSWFRSQFFRSSSTANQSPEFFLISLPFVGSGLPAIEEHFSLCSHIHFLFWWFWWFCHGGRGLWTLWIRHLLLLPLGPLSSFFRCHVLGCYILEWSLSGLAYQSFLARYLPCCAQSSRLLWYEAGLHEPSID